MSKIIGRRYGRSTVISSKNTHRSASGKYHYMYTLRCDCGFEYTLRDKSLGNAKEPCSRCRPSAVKNPDSAYAHPLYGTWVAMHQRCNNPSAASYAAYGGKGVYVCPRWTGAPRPPNKVSVEGFRAFVEDMGDKPTPEHTLDRIDAAGPYSPENCRWSTPAEQGANRSTTVWVEAAGERLPFAHWMRRFWVDPSHAFAMIRQGMTHREVVEHYIKLYPKPIPATVEAASYERA
jgi:hypothetical protein